MKKKLAYLPLIALCLMLLSGCFSLKGEVSVDPSNDTISGSASFFYPKAIWSKMDDDTRRSFLTAPVPSTVKAEPFQADGGQGVKYTFEATPMKTLVKKEGLERFPVFISRDSKGVFTISGNFRQLLVPASKLKDTGVDIDPTQVPDPAIELVLNLPAPIANPPKGLITEGNMVRLTLEFIKTNPDFTLKTEPYAPSKTETPDGSVNPKGTNVYDDFAKNLDNEDYSYYPLIKEPRPMGFIYLFAFMVVGGIGLALYGHFGNLRWLTARKKAKSDQADKDAKVKPEKKKKK